MQLLVKVDLLVLQVLELFGVGGSGIDFFFRGVDVLALHRSCSVCRFGAYWIGEESGQSGETQGREMLGMLEMVKWRARCS